MLDKDLFKLIGDNKKYVAVSVVLQVLSLIANIAITACICQTVYLLSTGAQLASYWVPAVGAVAAILLRFVCSVASGDVKDVLGRRIKKDLREKAYRKIVELGIKSTDELGMSGLTQVGIEGIEQLDLYFTSYLPQFFFAMIAPFVIFAICVWVDWRSSLVLLGCIPLIPLSILAVSRYAKKIFSKYWGKYTDMGDYFLDNVQGLKELKLFQADEAVHKKLNGSAEDFRKATMSVLTMQLVSTTVMDTVAYGGAGLGIAMAICGTIFWGVSPLAALFITLVAVEFFLPLRAFGSAFHVAMNGASAGKKLNTLLQQKATPWGTKDVQGTEIELKDVSFSYDEQREVLKHVNMQFQKNRMTAIVGESGCGKSTVVSLLSGVHPVTSGQILVGGTPLQELSRESWYQSLAVVSCNTYVFNESLRENFHMANASVSDEKIYEALAKVNMDEFVRQNGGLDKIISEDASNLSGGQKQRLAIAISSVSDKQVYVFDEATSNIDVESESIIMENIRALAKEKGVVLISHRLENVVPADEIYYMENGEVKESGTHAELMKQNGGYAKLYSTQKALEKGFEEVAK